MPKHTPVVVYIGMRYNPPVTYGAMGSEVKYKVTRILLYIKLHQAKTTTTSPQGYRIE